MNKRAMPSISSSRQPATQPNENTKKPTDDASSHRDSRRRQKYDCVLSGRYRLQRTVGTGNFAKVKLAIHIATGREVAIKIIDKNELTTSGRRKVGCTRLTLLFIPVFWKLTREVQLMKELNHPNIVKLLEIIETERFTYLVLEYLKGGEVYDWLANNGRMTESMAREKFRQILSAVEYCHQKGIIHRDLKAENLLFDEQMNVKLVDFGFANKFNQGSKLNTFCGSAPYAAPELFKGKEYNGPEVDVWSLGIILYKLVSGGLPFDGQSLSELRHQVVRGNYRVPFYMTTECESLLKKMIRVEANKRDNIKAIMKHRWVNQGFENDVLQPYVEPKKSPRDSDRFQALIKMGYSFEAIINSFREKRFDEIHAAYMLTQSNPAIPVGEPTNGRPPSPGNTLSENKKASEDRNSVLLKQHRVSFYSDVNTPKINGDIYKTTTKPLVNENGGPMRPDNAELVNGEPSRPRVILITSSNKNGDLNDNGSGRSSAFAYEPKLSNEYTDEKQDTIIHQPDNTHNFLNPYEVRPIIRPYEEEPEIVKPPTRQIVPLRSKTFNTKKSGDTKANYQGGHEITIGVEQTSPGPAKDAWINNIRDTSQFVRYTPFRQTVHGTHSINQTRGNPTERKTPDKLSIVGKARINLFEVDENEPLTEVSGEEKDSVDRSRTFLRTVTSKIIRSKPTEDRFKPLNTNFQPDKHIQTQIAHDYSYLPKTDTTPLVAPSTWQNTYPEEASGSKDSRDLIGANGKDSPVNKEPVASVSTVRANNAGSPRGLSFIRTWTTRLKKRSGSKSSEDSNSMVTPASSRSSECNDDRDHSISIPLANASGPDAKTTSRPSDDKTADGWSWTKTKGTSQSKIIRAATTIQPNFREQISTQAGKFSDSPEGEDNADASQNHTKPRNLKFSMFVKNTSRKPLEQIQPEIRRTLIATGCTFVHTTQFLFTCEHRTYDQKDLVKFELEICTLSLKNCFAIHYKKVSGEYLHYRNLIAKIAKEMNI